jgi:hypothetical protein
MRSALVISSLLALSFSTGCVYSLRPYNTPSQQKLHFQTAMSTNYAVRVADEESIPVPANGRFVFDVPSLPRGCDTHLLGVIKVGDGSPERIPAIHVLRHGKVVRRLSLEPGFQACRSAPCREDCSFNLWIKL